MSTVIRLARHGCKKNPFFYIVAIDKRRKTNGIFIERLGYYNPLTDDIKIDLESMDKLAQNGAQVSKRVKSVTKIYLKQNAAQA